MQNIGLIFLAFAFVCAVLAAFNVQGGRFNLGWAAIAFWIASELIGGVARSGFLH